MEAKVEASLAPWVQTAVHFRVHFRLTLTEPESNVPLGRSILAGVDLSDTYHYGIPSAAHSPPLVCRDFNGKFVAPCVSHNPTSLVVRSLTRSPSTTETVGNSFEYSSRLCRATRRDLSGKIVNHRGKVAGALLRSLSRSRRCCARGANALRKVSTIDEQPRQRLRSRRGSTRRMCA